MDISIRAIGHDWNIHFNLVIFEELLPDAGRSILAFPNPVRKPEMRVIAFA